MAGTERKDNDNKKQNRYTQANKQTNKENPPTGPPFAPIHLLSVVQINILCLWWHTLKGLVGGISLSIRPHCPGRVPGLSPWSSPVLPSSLSLILTLHPPSHLLTPRWSRNCVPHEAAQASPILVFFVQCQLLGSGCLCQR